MVNNPTSNYRYETENIAKSKKNNEGVYVVPAFSGIGAPYWSSSMDILSGDLIKAILPSLGGLFIVIPLDRKSVV